MARSTRPGSDETRSPEDLPYGPLPARHDESRAGRPRPPDVDEILGFPRSEEPDAEDAPENHGELQELLRRVLQPLLADFAEARKRVEVLESQMQRITERSAQEEGRYNPLLGLAPRGWRQRRKPRPAVPDLPEPDADGDVELGEQLAKDGRVEEAEAAYRRADRSGDAAAAFNLGLLLYERGATAEAEDAYRRADERGHAGATANLAVLLEERGAFEEAEDAYRRAEERGEALAAFNLGRMFEERGALADAADAYRRAEERGTDEVADLARAALAEISA